MLIVLKNLIKIYSFTQGGLLKMKVNFSTKPELILNKNINICDLFSNGEVTLNKDSKNLQLEGNKLTTPNSSGNIIWLAKAAPCKTNYETINIIF